MFIVSYAAKYYGPFETADAGAIFAEVIVGPCKIVLLHERLEEIHERRDTLFRILDDAPGT